MKILQTLALTSVAAVALTACSSMGRLPQSGSLPHKSDALAITNERFVQDAGSAGITRVQIPGATNSSNSRRPVSADIRSRPINVGFVASTATMGDLVDALTASDIQIAFRWTNDDQSVLQKKLPFTRFNGTMGSLLDALRTGMGVVSWQEGNLVFFSDRDQYSVAVPQENDIISTLSSQLTSLGATDVVQSLEGGKILFNAPPAVYDERIRPFLDKTVRNLSTINMQVAIVSLAMTDNSSHGFDWAKFSAMIDGRSSSSLLTAREGGSVNLSASGLSLGVTNIGDVFGVKAVQSISGAIDFLSTFGHANVTQNVDLRTISGKEVSIRSGQDIPYVKSVGAVSDGGTVTGSSETGTVQTGLTVAMTPRFDSVSGVVTVKFDLDLRSVVEFVELNAGSQIGTLTQPRTQEQKLTDIVQMRAGQTVVIGGLQYDQEAYNGSEPTLLRDITRKNSLSLSSRSNDVTRSSLFVIMRPTVTIYESGVPEVLGAGVGK